MSDTRRGGLLSRRGSGQAPSRLVQRVAGRPEAGPAGEPPPEEEGKKRKRIWWIVGLVGGGVLVLGVVLLLLLGKPGDGGPEGRATETPAAGTPAGTALPVAPGQFFFLPPQEHPQSGWELFRPLLGDVNGDGRAEIIWNMTAEVNLIYVGLAQADGSFDLLPVQERSERYWSGFKTLLGDLNGDGRGDLIWNETTEHNRTYVGLGREDGTFDLLPFQDREERYWSGFQTFVGDVNGDGRGDLIWNETTEHNRTYVGLGREDGTLAFLPFQDRAEQGWKGFRTLVGDVNGDGRSDLIWNGLAGRNRVYTALGQKDGTFVLLPAQDHPREEGWEGFRVLVGEVNGDGRSDLVWNLTAQTNRLYVALGQEDGTFTFQEEGQERTEVGWGGFQTLVGDVNGDGRSDLVWNELAGHNRIYVGLGQEEGTFTFLPVQDHTETDWEGFRTLLGDVNGDGRDDLVWNRLQAENRIYVGLAGE